MTSVKSKIYGYMRTSTDKQDILTQKREIEKYAEKQDWKITEIIQDEGVSGFKTDWNDRAIKDLVENKIKKGDIILVYDISRLARKMAEIQTIAGIVMKKKATLIAIQNNLILSDTDLSSKLMLSCFSMGAEIERNILVVRTKSNLQCLRESIEKGQKVPKKTKDGTESPYNMIGICGRVRKAEDGSEQILRKGTSYKSKLDSYKEEIEKRLEEGQTVSQISTDLNLKYDSLRKWLKRPKNIDL